VGRIIGLPIENYLLPFKRSSKKAFSIGGRLASQLRNLFGSFCRTRYRNASTELSAGRAQWLGSAGNSF
jgi:hypothetical protein